jgi:hypothetical protein
MLLLADWGMAKLRCAFLQLLVANVPESETVHSEQVSEAGTLLFVFGSCQVRMYDYRAYGFPWPSQADSRYL